MLFTLAQTDRDQALTQGYGLIVAIAAIGLLAIVLLLLVFLGRRWTQRQLKQIEADKAERRAMRSAGRVDAWRAGAERYVDRDKLPEGELGGQAHPEDDEEDHNDGEDLVEDEAEDQDNAFDEDDDDPPPPGWDEPGPDDEDADPYGLFDDKPYREADDEDDDAFDDEDAWDDDEDEDDDLDSGPRGR
ncbi:MAG: hypothetical protein ACE37H_00510 [Phycisphaeraceae bacterium]